jgi:hypothetical protein
MDSEGKRREVPGWVITLCAVMVILMAALGAYQQTRQSLLLNLITFKRYKLIQFLLKIDKYLVNEPIAGIRGLLIVKKDFYPAHLAIFVQDKELLKLLIANGACVDSDNGQGLDLAIGFNDREALTILLNAGAKPTPLHLYSALRLGSSASNIPKMLILHGVEIDDTLYHCDSLEDIKIMINNGANPSHSDAHLLAASQGRTDIVEFLLEHGADVHLRNDEAIKNISFSIINNLNDILHSRKIDMLRLLVKHGADLNVLSAEDRARVEKILSEDAAASRSSQPEGAP